MNNETYEGELLGVVPELTFDTLSRVQWKKKTGELIYIKDMEDSVTFELLYTEKAEKE